MIGSLVIIVGGAVWFLLSLVGTVLQFVVHLLVKLFR